MLKRGFHWFVAMRYLRGHSVEPPRATVEKPGAVDVLAAIAGSARAAARVIWHVMGRVVRHGSGTLKLLTIVSLVAMIGGIAMRYAVLDKPNPFRPVDPMVQA